MGRVSVIQAYWTPFVRPLLKNDQLKNAEVLVRLGRDMALRPRGFDDAPDLPSERTVQRIRKAWQSESSEVQAQYGYARWPESFDSGALPWESAAVVLQLVQVHHVSGFERPTVRLAKWFYRVTLAAPDAPVIVRYDAARNMAMNEAAGSGTDGVFRFVEGQFAAGPWRSDEADAAWRAERLAAVEQAGVASPFTATLDIKKPGALRAALAELPGMGPGMADATVSFLQERWGEQLSEAVVMPMR